MASRTTKRESRPIAVADVETTMITPGVRPTTLFWGICVEGTYHRFETSYELWEWLKEQDSLLIYCHTQFDMLQLISEGFDLRIRDVRNGRVLRCYGPDKHEWRDSHALFSSKLADILQACGFAKPSMDELEERNRADTVDALKAFRVIGGHFEDVFGVSCLGSQSLTAGSVCFRAAEKLAGELPRWLMDREAYRGGRVEAFRLGNCGEAEQWDINSSYPYSFVDAPISDVLYYADVWIDCDGPAPFFWLRHDVERKHQKLMFPRGQFSTAFWGSNYERYIRQWGGIKAIRIYDRVPYSFEWLRKLAPLMQRAYDLRAEAKRKKQAALAYALKIGLNSIYGRLGMKAVRETVLDGPRAAAGEDVTIYELRPGARYLSFKTVPSTPRANYLFAGFVTDNARARLYDGLMRAGPESVYYCDTDSVFCRPGALDSLEPSTEFGGWSYEGSAPLRTIGAKDYVWGEKTTLKGGRSFKRWTLKTIARGLPVQEVVRTRQTDYDKRTVLLDGSTHPVDAW